MTGLRSFDNDTCKRVLDLLESGYLRLRNIVLHRITVNECPVRAGSGAVSK